MTAMDIEDDIGLVFDDGNDEELEDLRLVHPWFAITRTRTRTGERWTATPTWTKDGRIEAATKAELVEQMSKAAGEYRISLMTRDQQDWPQREGGAWTGH